MITFDQIIKELQAEFPSFKLVKKHESKFMAFLFTVMLMKYWCPEYMTRFTTVFRCTVYMPEQFIGTDAGADILRHERVHMRDSRGWRILYYGPMYCILPIGPSGRAYWEFRGYKESMRAYYERWGIIPNSAIDFWCSNFTGSNYLYMMPFESVVRKWFIKAKEEIINGK